MFILVTVTASVCLWSSGLLPATYPHGLAAGHGMVLVSSFPTLTLCRPAKPHNIDKPLQSPYMNTQVPSAIGSSTCVFFYLFLFLFF
ncbi:hypothetical protein GGS21DRAFT_196741 [Xylaria nigripes]|nr:hypothetical protein GGS21DRAFT_196741 [Xylaria nigripes]